MHRNSRNSGWKLLLVLCTFIGKGWRKECWVNYKNATGVGNKELELNCETPDADWVAVTKTWLQLSERYNKMMEREYSIFRMNRGHGRKRGGLVILKLKIGMYRNYINWQPRTNKP